ncbi:MAG: hypothetical protein PHX51_07460 [Clostridia bacterium]|nr:hypothetical protein [Clostridia bacterium]
MNILEAIFDTAYLALIITFGVMLIQRSPSKGGYRVVGAAAVVLGVGDCFHLLPRLYFMFFPSGIAFVFANWGNLANALALTVFYVLLFYFWRRRTRTYNTYLDIGVWALVTARLVLCILPQNAWGSASMPLMWTVLRNIPLLLLCVLLIVLFAKTRKISDKLWYFSILIGVSILIHSAVVLFSDTVSSLELLMLLKPFIYVWIAIACFKRMQAENKFPF